MAGRQALVKVGNGKYLTFDDGAGVLMSMSSGALLKALKHDEAFEVKLRDVALDDCTVRVCASASDEEPSEAEVRGAHELKGAKKLGDLPAGTAGNLFIHVQLPALAAAGAGAGGAFTPLPDGTMPPEHDVILRSSVIGIDDSEGNSVCTAVFYSPTHALTAYHDAKPEVGSTLGGRAAPNKYHPSGQRWTFKVVAVSTDDDVVVLERLSGPVPTHVLPLLGGSASIDRYNHAHVMVANFGVHAASRGGDVAGSLLLGSCAEWTAISAIGERHFAYACNCGLGDSGGAVLNQQGQLVGLHLGGWNGADSPPPSPEAPTSSAGGSSSASETRRRKNAERRDAMGLAFAAMSVADSVTKLARQITTGGYAIFISDDIVTALCTTGRTSAGAGGKRKR